MNVLAAGYNDKLTLLVQKIIEKIRDCSIRTEQFSRVKEQLQLEYDSFSTQPPTQLGLFTRSHLTETPRWHINQYREAVTGVTIESIRLFHERLIRNFKVAALVHGNVNRTQFDEIIASIRNTLHLRAVPLSEFTTQRMVKIPASPSWFVLESNIENVQETNNLVIAHYQIGQQNVRDDVLLDLTKQIIDKPFFHQLRTVEQIGYVVASRADKRLHVIGLDLFVMSSSRSVDYIHHRMEDFITQIFETIKGMDEAEFTRHINAICVQKKEKPKTLLAKTEKLWQEISTSSFKFTRVEEEIAALESVTKSEFISFFERHFFTEPHRYAVYMKSKVTPPESAPFSNRITIKNPEVFKQKMFLFPANADTSL
eukprot:c9899_g1_i6.p1 GENE.c9899_g1_i6~~c9899_g1_i6.p1  ORF type:complete len:369 (-),score=87.47 c9899_g1_i6:107-1213(-)